MLIPFFGIGFSLITQNSSGMIGNVWIHNIVHRINKGKLWGKTCIGENFARISGKYTHGNFLINVAFYGVIPCMIRTICESILIGIFNG